MKRMLLPFLVIVIIFVSCTPFRTENQISRREVSNEEQPEELTVYVMGDHVSGKMKGEHVDYYITGYTLGPFGPQTNAAREKGHMLYNPMQRFERETGIHLDIHYFGSMQIMEQQIIEDRKKGEVPDIIISNHNAWATHVEYDNIYRLIHNGWFADLMPYLEWDEIYDGGEYYNKVLQAGMLGEQQYIIPISFNMNAVFSSKEDMQEVGVTIEPGMESVEILQQLKYACEAGEEGELVLDTLSLAAPTVAIILDYWESTGFSVVDYETGEVTLNREIFEELALMFKEYLQMNMVEDWDTVIEEVQPYLVGDSWAPWGFPSSLETLEERKPELMLMEEAGLEWMNQGTFFYENSTFASYVHTLPGQCAALGTLYEDLNEEMVMVSVPMYNYTNQYMAQVQMFGGVMTESEYPYHSYQLFKYLMDQEYDPYYVIPLKKKNAEKMLDTLSSSVYTLYLRLGAAWDYEVDFTEEVETYDVQPLTQEYKEQLQYMLDHIGGATLPEGSVYEPLIWHIEAYVFELETMDEAYENACEDLEKHLEYIMAGDSAMEFKTEGYTYR